MFIVPIDIQDGVNDLHASANESIFLFFVCRMTHMNAQKCYWMLIKMQISLLNLIYAQMFVLSRSWMSLRAIEGRFTQMIAYFLVMNSKRCSLKYYKICRHFYRFPSSARTSKSWILRPYLKGHCHQYLDNFEKQRDIF